MSNGVIRGEFYSEPIYYRKEETGEHLPVDSALETVTVEGRAVAKNRANGFGLELPEVMGDGWASVRRDDQTIRMRPASAAGDSYAHASRAAAKRDASSKNRISYDGAFGGASLQYESLPDGLKEKIVLSEPTSATAFCFEMELRGLTPHLQDDGSIVLAGGDGEPSAFSIDKPCMWDSRTSPDGSSYSDAVRYEIARSGESWRLSVIADAEWLASPARVYPVVIDPTVLTTSGQPLDTYITSNSLYQNKNYSTSAYLWVDNQNPNSNWLEYTLVQPGATFTNDLAWKKALGYRVVAATMQMNVNQVVSGGTIVGTRCSTPVTISAVTWATRPDVADDHTSSETNAAGGSNNVFNMTQIAKYWQANDTTATLATVQFNTTTSGARFSYRSSDYAPKPLFTVDYAPVPDVAITSPSEGATDSIYSMNWSFDEALGNPQSAYEIEVTTDTAAPAIASSNGTGSAQSAPIPTPEQGWVNGTTYFVRVRGASSPSTDTPLMWSEWSSWRKYTLATVQPITRVSIETTSSGWFEQQDVDKDFVADEGNDSPDQGRGSVTLAWDPVPNASRYDIYLHDGNAFRQVDSVTEAEWTSAGKSLFPADSVIASLPADYTGDPFEDGTLDLRDDPGPLYRKTPGAAFDSRHDYLFKVVPEDAYLGDVPISECSTVSVVLPNRTRYLNEDPRHTEHDFGEMLGHQVSANLDTAGLEVDLTDLEIASWGPDARLSRHYNSGLVSATSFAPGWRFNFEQALTVVGGIATFTDEQGEVHRFIWDSTGDRWISPHGFTGTLTQSNGFTLTRHDGTILQFDATGALTSERDRNGNVTAYTPDGEDLVITAPNGQSLFVDRDVTGKVLSAEYGTSLGTRRVEYSGGATPTVTYDYGTPDPLNRTLAYGYGSSRLTSISLLDWPSLGEQEDVGFDYSSDRLTQVRNPGYEHDSGKRADISYNSDSATISRYGVVDGSASEVPVIQSYTWNANGTCASKELLHTSSESLPSWTYDYSPENFEVAEHSPILTVTRSVVDSYGDVLAERDERGNETTYVRDGYGQPIAETDALGNTLYREYDEAGNVATEWGRGPTKVWVYDGHGRLTDEYGGEVEEQHFSDFAPSGEPQRTSYGQVRRAWNSPGPGPSDELTQTKVIDDFGNVTRQNLSDLVAGSEGAVEFRDAVYTVSGLQISVADGAGTITKQIYDALGNVTETWREDGSGRRVGWTRRDYDSWGSMLSEEYLDSTGNVGYSKSFTYDSLGRQISSSDSGQGSDLKRYDARGNVVAEWGAGADQGSLIAATRNAYDLASRVTSSCPAGNADTQAQLTTYFANGAERRVTEASGAWTEWTYDVCGNKLTETTPDDEGIPISTSYRYDNAGRIIAETSPAGFVTTHSYDDFGREITTGGTTRTYNEMGWVLIEQEQDSISKKYEYAPSGRVHRLRQPDESTITEYAFDDAGRVVETTNPDGKVIHSGYDAFGRPVLESQKKEATSTAYLKELHTCYDDFDRTICTTDSVSGLVTRNSYRSGSSQVATEVVAYPSGVMTVTTSFDSLGRETSRSVSYPGGSTSRKVDSRDLADRETVWKVGTLTTGTASFDEDGRTSSQTGPGRSTATSYTYDNESGKKVSEQHFLSYPFSWSSDYSYKDGRLARATIAEASNAYAYDPAGNLTGVLSSSGTSTTFSYSEDNQLESTTVNVGEGDDFNRQEGPLGADWQVVAGTCSVANNMFWTSNGGVAKYVPAGDDLRDVVISAKALTIRNCLVWGITKGGSYNTYDYFQVRRSYSPDHLVLIERVQNGVATELARKTDNTYGSRLTVFVKDSIATVSFADDPGWGHLTASLVGYAGGAVGLSCWGVGYIDDFAVSTDASSITTTFCFDPVTGNRLSQGPPSNPNETTFGYDEGQRLTEFQSSSASAKFEYDANGQRTRSVESQADATITTTYQYADLQLLSLRMTKETSSTTTTETIALAYEGSGSPLMGTYRNETTGIGKTFYLVTSDRGDIIELLDSEGGPFARYEYDAWGNPTRLMPQQGSHEISKALATAIAGLQPLRYAGYAYDSFSGLYYCSQRYYDPATYQFLTKDPAKDDGEESAYQYCGGDPVGNLDPSGLAARRVALIFWGRNHKNPSFFHKIAGYWSYVYGRNGYKPVVVRAHTVSAWIDALSKYKNIGQILYYGHGGEDHLYLSEISMGRSDVARLPKKNVRKDARIQLFSCEGGRRPGGIASAFSGHFGRPTLGARGGVSFIAYHPVVTWKHRDKRYPMWRQWVWR